MGRRRAGAAATGGGSGGSGGVSFNAVAHGGERAGLKAYLRNREWREHAWVCGAMACIGVAVFVALLGSSAKTVEARNSPMFISFPSSRNNEYGSPNALHRHSVRLRDVLFPPPPAGSGGNASSTWLVLCQARPPAETNSGMDSSYASSPSDFVGKDDYAIHPSFLDAAFLLDGMGAAIAMNGREKSAVARSAALSQQQRRRAEWEAQHQKPLRLVLRTLVQRMYGVLTGSENDGEDSGADDHIWFDNAPPKTYAARVVSLPVTLSLAVIDCDEKRYEPKLFRAPGSKMHEEGKPLKLWSLSMGLGLQSAGSEKDEPAMFVTSHRRPTRQLTAAETRTSKSILRAVNRISNYQGKLATIKSNADLSSKCLDGSAAEGCVLVLRKGPLDKDSGAGEPGTVRTALREVLPKHRHLFWAQIDLDQHELQPLPSDSGSGDAWPRLAVLHSAHEKVKMKKKKKKSKKSRANDGNRGLGSKKRLVTRWKWYPAHRSMSDAEAISNFIELADRSNWTTLKPLPSLAKDRLRVVKRRRKMQKKKKQKKKPNKRRKK